MNWSEDELLRSYLDAGPGYFLDFSCRKLPIGKADASYLRSRSESGTVLTKIVSYPAGSSLDYQVGARLGLSFVPNLSVKAWTGDNVTLAVVHKLRFVLLLVAIAVSSAVIPGFASVLFCPGSTKTRNPISPFTTYHEPHNP